MTTDDLIAYYVELLIMQYATQDKAQATVAAFVRQAIQDQIVLQVENAFGFSVSPIGPEMGVSAEGAQLNDVASYCGAQRVYFGLAPNAYFELPDTADSPPADGFNGFMDALDSPANTTWLFLTTEQTKQPIYSLTDDELYRLTQLRSQVQSAFYGLGELDAILETFFGNNVALLDNENMTLLYVDLTSDLDTLFTVAAVSGSLPKPAGVRIQAIRADLLTDFFGLQNSLTGYDSTFVGFSDAETALTTGTFIAAP